MQILSVMALSMNLYCMQSVFLWMTIFLHVLFESYRQQAIRLVVDSSALEEVSFR